MGKFKKASIVYYLFKNIRIYVNVCTNLKYALLSIIMCTENQVKFNCTDNI